MISTSMLFVWIVCCVRLLMDLVQSFEVHCTVTSHPETQTEIYIRTNATFHCEISRQNAKADFIDCIDGGECKDIDTFVLPEKYSYNRTSTSTTLIIRNETKNFNVSCYNPLNHSEPRTHLEIPSGCNTTKSDDDDSATESGLSNGAIAVIIMFLVAVLAMCYVCVKRDQICAFFGSTCGRDQQHEGDTSVVKITMEDDPAQQPSNKSQDDARGSTCDRDRQHEGDIPSKITIENPAQQLQNKSQDDVAKAQGKGDAHKVASYERGDIGARGGCTAADSERAQEDQSSDARPEVKSSGGLAGDVRGGNPAGELQRVGPQTGDQEGPRFRHVSHLRQSQTHGVKDGVFILHARDDENIARIIKKQIKRNLAYHEKQCVDVSADVGLDKGKLISIDKVLSTYRWILFLESPQSQIDSKRLFKNEAVKVDNLLQQKTAVEQRFIPILYNIRQRDLKRHWLKALVPLNYSEFGIKRFVEMIRQQS